MEIFGSSVPECVRSGGSRWVGGGVRGGGENALLAELLGGSGDNWAVREEIAALGGGPAARAASFLPHRRRFEESGGGALAFWMEGARWD